MLKKNIKIYNLCVIIHIIFNFQIYKHSKINIMFFIFIFNKMSDIEGQEYNQYEKKMK